MAVNSLYVALELVDGALVQVAAEERQQVGREEEGLHQGSLGQLLGHLEDGVRPEEENPAQGTVTSNAHTFAYSTFAGKLHSEL